MKRLTTRLGMASAGGMGLMLALVWLLSSPRSAELPVAYAAEWHVCLNGCPYTSIQAAVDAASDGDVIKVAAGTYTGVDVRPRHDITTTGVVTQMEYVSKTITIQGGYTTTNWTTSDPIANAPRSTHRGRDGCCTSQGTSARPLKGCASQAGMGMLAAAHM